MGESFQFAGAFWNRSPDRVMDCTALMSHGRWMHLRICRKRASAADLFRLLRPSRERRKSETDSENDREPDQRHEHLGGGWLAGSLAERRDAHQRPGLDEHRGVGPACVTR